MAGSDEPALLTSLLLPALTVAQISMASSIPIPKTDSDTDTLNRYRFQYRYRDRMMHATQRRLLPPGWSKYREVGLRAPRDEHR